MRHYVDGRAVSDFYSGEAASIAQGRGNGVLNNEHKWSVGGDSGTCTLADMFSVMVRLAKLPGDTRPLCGKYRPGASDGVHCGCETRCKDVPNE